MLVIVGVPNRHLQGIPAREPVSLAYMNLLQDRLKLALTEKGATQTALATACGVRSPSVNDWLTGKTKRLTGMNLLRASEFLGVRQEWLAEGTGPMRYADGELTRLSPAIPAHASPVSYKRPEDLGDGYVWVDQVDAKLSAGDGVVEWIVREERQVAFRESWFKHKRLGQDHCKLLSVKGRSMEPMLEDGDVVLIDLSDNQAEDGEIYACTHNGKLFIKQLVHGDDGLEMRSLNPSFAPVKIKHDDHFQVLGRKVWRGG